MIKAHNLHKRFDEVLAVDGVSFEIATGEVFGLLGPNGAGKTTTINMLVGALRPDQGTVTLDNNDDPTQPRLRKFIGTAPQSLALYEELTAEENIRFYGQLYGLSGTRLKERVEWSLKLAGLEDRRKSRVKTFSGGMQRRLNMVCGLVHDPTVLFFDEPTVGVDPQSRNLVFDRIEQLKADGRTIVYTTHYMEEAERLCDRVAIVDHGKILDIGTVDELIERHGGKSTVVAELEETPPASVSLPAELIELKLTFESDNPIDEVARMRSEGVRFRSLVVNRANLESVFLNLTGRRLRD